MINHLKETPILWSSSYLFFAFLSLQLSHSQPPEIDEWELAFLIGDKNMVVPVDFSIFGGVLEEILVGFFKWWVWVHSERQLIKERRRWWCSLFWISRDKEATSYFLICFWIWMKRLEAFFSSNLVLWRCRCLHVLLHKGIFPNPLPLSAFLLLDFWVEGVAPHIPSMSFCFACSDCTRGLQKI